MTVTPNRPQVVIVGAGVAGYQAARALSRRVGDGAEIVLVNPTGVALHPQLLPQVMMGVLSPDRVSVLDLRVNAALLLAVGAMRFVRRQWNVTSANVARTRPRTDREMQA
jgi:2-polyprenyl-6-methoxyphenol hydroxylase-like FAD-dependent oxidoreductase